MVSRKECGGATLQEWLEPLADMQEDEQIGTPNFPQEHTAPP